jgi:hypothetical protein
MDEYLCLTVRSQPGESQAAFQGRLAEFWTRMLRTRPDDYEKVYAETTKFEAEDGTITRQYLIESPIAAVLTAELSGSQIDCDPVDEDDVYSKYEAAPPDWFWIEH